MGRGNPNRPCRVAGRFGGLEEGPREVRNQPTVPTPRQGSTAITRRKRTQSADRDHAEGSIQARPLGRRGEVDPEGCYRALRTSSNDRCYLHKCQRTPEGRTQERCTLKECNSARWSPRNRISQHLQVATSIGELVCSTSCYSTRAFGKHFHASASGIACEGISPLLAEAAA